jgi:SAM-dependent methyltransferase
MPSQRDADTSSAESHWSRVYAEADADLVSWYEERPDASLRLIEAARASTDSSIIDVGGGVSLLAGHLLDRGYDDVTVLDVASQAIELARERLAERARRVAWLTADVTRFDPPRRWDLWHDRAVFHFLVEPEARDAYRACLLRALAPGAGVVLATFGPRGPERCSGLPVRRYSPGLLAAELGPSIELTEHFLHTHVTPTGGEQQFLYALFRAGV